MKMNTKTCLIITICLSAQLAFAQPFHGWRGENRDGIYRESGQIGRAHV